MPQNSNLESSTDWFTQSNAFVRSQKIPPTVNLLLRASKILFIRLNEASSVDEFFLKPYCSGAKILLLTWLHNLLKITFSNILEKDVSMEYEKKTNCQPAWNDGKYATVHWLQQCQ